ncbi:ABC transporter substrate-binding protein [Mycolicibacterium rufum]|uniref:ABC transporter substrate-binding protein n=1 Tax=Mycolicibacterium rufum TaxID=318424 RepID=A0A9X2YEG1_9MYCO|nr:ABC transporter substrate-binding protein [Mycolicibacterium rufum]KGI68085.1 ABC transporter substrate-binding protein [Mycolicibacterium rufum]MCV7072554.1 amino acid ABC transporter substrate-binding protein [Mycolicibacterium rufum]ULP39103.1 ABC transporter substrate-binding protein [Mycolicibacterium rufum]
MAVLTVGVAYPDPPFNAMPGDTGLDIEVMRALAAKLGDEVTFVGYDGADFDGIFDRLGAGEYDCVIAGTTVTPQRAAKAAFLPPYVISGQGLAVDTERLPHVRSVDDLAGLTIGVQRGNTSEAIAEGLVAEGKAARVRLYDYGAISTAIADLGAGGCDAVMKLAPVLAQLVRDVPGVEVVARGLSVEDIAIAVAPTDTALLARLQVAQAELEEDSTLQKLRRRWLGNPYVDQSVAVL